MTLAAWVFQVFLDDAAIGTHRFVLSERGVERELVSEARFDVKFLFFDAYRYRHDATERWRGDCLASIEASTDDDRQKLAVSRKSLAGCVMSFAYWNPAILKRSELLNAQTGQLEKVVVTDLGAGHYRITGSKHPIDLWYAPNGQWIALESDLGGRRLRYRLQ